MSKCDLKIHDFIKEHDTLRSKQHKMQCFSVSLAALNLEDITNQGQPVIIIRQRLMPVRKFCINEDQIGGHSQ